MGKRAALLLASLVFCGVLAACVPPAPLAVAGTLPPPSTTYAIVGEDGVAKAARQPLIDALATHGLRLVTDRPDRFVEVTLADRPRASGTVAGNALPPSHNAPGWVDRPVKGGLFAKGRREVRLTIRFLSADGKVREERAAYEVVTRTAPDPDIARLVGAALKP
jgi:hypothetical protein